MNMSHGRSHAYVGGPPATRSTRSKLLFFVSRLVRWLETHSIPLTPEQIGFAEGLRAATAVAVMVAAAYVTESSVLAWAAFAAFWTCLADPGGPDRSRFYAMGSFAVTGTIAAALMSSTAMLGPLVAGSVLLVLVFLCSLSRSFGSAAAQSGVLTSAVAVVAVTYPRPPEAALQLAATFLGGCAWALVLCLFLWRIHPHAPLRRAVSAIYGRLDDMIADLSALDRGGHASDVHWSLFNADHRRSVRNAIERARAQMARFPDGEDIELKSLLKAVDTSDRVFAVLIAIGHHLGARDRAFDLPGARQFREQLRPMLAEAQKQAGRGMPDGSKLADEAASLTAAAAPSAGFMAKVTVAYATAFTELAHCWSPFNEFDRQCCKETQAIGAKLTASINTGIVRHAARVAVAVVIAFAVSEQLGLAYSYWATMATVVVMQPAASATWPRSVERMLGSIGGGLVAALSVALLPTRFDLLCIIFPVAAATIALRRVNYTLFVLFLTPLFVFIAELLKPGHGLGSARAINNIIGSLIGVAGSLVLWPERERDAWDATLAAAIETNLTYAIELLRTGAMASNVLDAARRAASVASSTAETTRQRMVLEGRRRSAHLDEVGAILASLRDLAGAATLTWLEAKPSDGQRHRVHQYQSLVIALSRPSHPLPLDKAIQARIDLPQDDLDRALAQVVKAVATYACAKLRERVKKAEL
jgi:uncharacterized membrane protein YccC